MSSLALYYHNGSFRLAHMYYIGVEQDAWAERGDIPEAVGASQEWRIWCKLGAQNSAIGRKWRSRFRNCQNPKWSCWVVVAPSSFWKVNKVFLQTPGWNISIYIANHGKTHQGHWNSKNLIPVKLPENTLRNLCNRIQVNFAMHTLHLVS